jgi:hypothetical protein
MIMRAQTKLGIFVESLGGIAEITPLLLLPLLPLLAIAILGALLLAYILITIDYLCFQVERFMKSKTALN